MFKIFKSWRWLSVALSIGLIVSLTGCAKLQEALNQVITDYESSQGTEVVETTVDVEITGSVTAQNSEGLTAPVNQASVVVSYDNGNYENFGYTGTDGNFSVYGESLENVDEIQVSVSKSGYESGSSTVLRVGDDYDGDDTRIRIGNTTLSRDSGTALGGTIYGTVEFRFKGVPGAIVSINDSSGANVSEVKTNANGEYVYSGLTLGTSSAPSVYSLTVSKKDDSGTELFVQTTQSVSLSTPSYIDVKQNFVLEPTGDFADDFENTDYGIVYAQLVPSDEGNDNHDDGQGNSSSDKNEFELPSFVVEAKATLIEFKGKDSDGYATIPVSEQPETLIDRHTGQIIFPNVQEGEYVMRVQFGVEGAALDSTETVYDSYEYVVHTFPMENLTVLPDPELVYITKDQFGEISEAFDHIDSNNIWIENEVRINAGGWDSPASYSKLSFEKDGITFETFANKDGWFGLDLPESGDYVFKVYLKNENGSLEANPSIEESVYIQGPDNSQNSDGNYYNSWEWWSQNGHDWIVMIYKDLDSGDLASVPMGKIQGNLRLSGQDYNDLYSESIELEIYFVNDNSVSYTVTTSTGEFSVDVAMLNGGYRIKVLNSDSVTVANEWDEYWPQDQYSGGYNNSMDVWLRTQGLTLESKIYAKVGNDDIGVGGATVTLSKVEDGVKTFVADTVTYDGNKAEQHGEFTLVFPEDEGDFELVISGDDIKTKTLIAWIENDPNSGDDYNWHSYDSNLKGYTTWNGIKVKATSYLGSYFPVVKGKVGTDEVNMDNVKNAQVTISFVGTDLSASGTTDSEGNFEIENVPAFDGEMNLTVTKGSDTGKTDWTFRYDWNDVNAIKTDPLNFDDDVYVPWGNTSETLWVQYDGFELNEMFVEMNFNNNSYGVEGAILIVSDENDEEVSVSRDSKEDGRIQGVYIPKDGTYEASIMMAGFVTQTFDNQQLSKQDWDNHGWTAGQRFTLKVDDISNEELVSILPNVEVYGKVEFDGISLPGVEVVFTPSNEDDFRFVAVTDEDGDYSINIPQVGEYTITIDSEGFVEEVRNEWFDSHNGNSKEIDFDMKVPGDTGSMYVQSFKVGFLGTKEVGDTADEGVYVSATIEEWNGSNNVAFDGEEGVRVVLVDAENPETELIELTHSGFGVWSAGTMVVEGRTVIETSVFDGVEDMQLVIQSETSTSAGDFTHIIFPNQGDTWQLSQSEREVPSVGSYVYLDELDLDIVKNQNGIARLKVSFQNFWLNQGIDGLYEIRFTLDSNTSGTPDFHVQEWVNADSNSGSIYELSVEPWMWAGNDSLENIYPNGLPAGDWKVEVTLSKDSSVKVTTYDSIVVDDVMPWYEEYDGNTTIDDFGAVPHEATDPDDEVSPQVFLFPADFPMDEDGNPSQLSEDLANYTTLLGRLEVESKEALSVPEAMEARDAESKEVLTEIYPVQSDDSPTLVMLMLPNDFDGEMDSDTIGEAVNGTHVMIDLGGGIVTFHVLDNSSID
ncbi:carboxypeptidase regulatory-like domain-containing protein [bacterium]|jgi:hypothetical protein|nr:carboxypeptidase regulatory-like domain-containing protein [bacterium]